MKFLWILGMAFFVACVTGRVSSVSSSKPLQEHASEPVRLEPVPVRANTAAIENLTIGDVIRMEEPNTQNLYDDSRYDFPITMNSRVEGWIDYFTGRGRQHMERYLARSSRYIPQMKVILKRADMPEDLVYLALIESGFNLRARSRAKAVGPWQFIKGTGTRYGLRVDGWVDERRDPIRSTEAAAQYLRDLYLMFESWYLAASAYNAGEYKILRAVEELRTNNYWRICETNFLRRETKDYIPKLISAAIIAKNPTRYGFSDVAYQDPLEFENVIVDFPIPLKELARMADTSLEDVEDLNPALRRSMVPPGERYSIRIPVGTRLLTERGLVEFRKGTDGVVPFEHLVQKGETLDFLSRKYQIRPSDLMSANNLLRGERILPGNRLLIPRKGSAAMPVSVEGARKTPEIRRPSSLQEIYLTHKVKRGESLWTIAELYNVRIQDLFRWNRLKNSRIQAGIRLKVKRN